MVDEVEVRDTTNGARAAETLGSAFGADPLRGSRSAKRWTRIGVYLAILGYGPLYLFVFGYELRQVFTSWTVGLIIATIAIELAFWQMFKLRKRGAYPGVLLAELGSGHHLNSAAQHCLGVIQRLMGTRAAFLALCNGDDDFDLISVSGMGREAAERLLRAGVREVREAMRSQQPVPFRLPGGWSAESGVSRKDRLVFIPVAALRQPIGVLVVVGHRRNPDLKDGQLLSSVGVALGLSLESLRQGEEIRKSEERLHTVIASTPIVMFALDHEGTFMLAEGSGLDTLGFHPSHVLGRSVFDACQDMPQVLENVRRALAGEAFTTTLEVNGRVLEAWLSPVSDHNDELNGITGVVTDITERKRAEEELAKSRQMLGDIAEGITDEILLLSMDFEILWANRGALEQTGCEMEELIGKRCYRVGHLRDSPCEHPLGPCPILEFQKTGEPVTVAHTHCGANGKQSFVEVTAYPIKDENGQVVQFVHVSRDITERKRAEEALRQSETKFRTLAETASVATFIYQGTRLRYVNSAAETISGYTREELLTMDFWDVIHPDFQQVVKERGLARQRGEPVPPGYETKLLTKDGDERWVDFTVGLIEFEGKPAVVGTGFDITERKRADEALRESETKFRTLTETISAAAFIIQGTRFCYVNSTTEELTGYSREELLTMDFWDVIHPDFQQVVKERGLARQRGEDVPRRYEAKLLTKSGEEHWADLTVGVIEFEGKPAVLGTGFDITERKQMEETLRESEGRYRLLADNATDMIWTRDLSLRPTYTSPSVTRLRGHTVEEAMTQTLDEVLTPDSLQVARRTLAEEMAKESAEDKDLTRTRTLELEMYRKDGSTIWTEMTVNFLRDEENRPTGIMGVTRDISERKKAEEERERLHAELEVRAITDSLTGLYDHAHFYQRLAEDIERSRRYNHGFAVMMMDVDDFKRFNDSRGHQAGDEALRLVADCIRSGLRRSDLAFRYGGDEFAAILPRADSAMARAVVDRINGRIARRLKKTDDQAAAQLTLSAGIACFPDDGTAADDLVRIADDALYSAKWVARARDIMGQREDIQSLVSALVGRRAGAEVPTGQAPLRPEALHEQHARIVSSVASSIAVALKDAGVAQALEDPDMQILATVGAAAEIKDRYIRGHPERTSEGAMALAAEIGLPPERVRDIRIAGLLHDIGKITVSEGILNKPGKLTRREFATIKEHPIVGATLVSQVKGFEQLIPIIRHHHERFDGAGYPGGLAGEEIPVEARILSVVDVFDALTHERSYRNALSREEAIGELERGAGTQFDPAVLKAFLALVERRGEEPATPAQAAREDRQLAAAAAEGQKLKGAGER